MLVEQATRAEEAAARAADAAASAASSSNRRPDPIFDVGQSVHHYWAAWFPGCGAGEEKSQIKKKSRPSWFSSEVTRANCVCPTSNPGNELVQPVLFM